MAFNLFKKKETADIIFNNGNIYTLDREYPTAQSVAVKGGAVVAVGTREAVAELEGPDTEVVDLEGDTMVPGFICERTNVAEEAMDGTYLKLCPDMGVQEVLQTVQAYVDCHEADDFYMGCGFSGALLDTEEDDNPLGDGLTAICHEKPILLIADDAVRICLNDFAKAVVSAAAEELSIKTVTPAFVIGNLFSVDYEAITMAAMSNQQAFAKAGYTSIFNCGTYGVFDSAYRDVLIDAFSQDMLKQRYYGSMRLLRAFNERLITYNMAQRHTACAELDKKINFDTLLVTLSSQKENPSYMSREYFEGLCSTMADKGYSIRAIALDKEAALYALDIMGSLKASYRKLTFALEHDEEFTDEELSAIFSDDVVQYSHSSWELPEGTGEEIVSHLTEKAAERLGLSASLGSIEVGKQADFAIFKDDPFKTASKAEFEKLNTTMTILAGDIVYDAAEDSLEDWLKKMAEGYASAEDVTEE